MVEIVDEGYEKIAEISFGYSYTEESLEDEQNSDNNRYVQTGFFRSPDNIGGIGFFIGISPITKNLIFVKVTKGENGKYVVEPNDFQIPVPNIEDGELFEKVDVVSEVKTIGRFKMPKTSFDVLIKYIQNIVGFKTLEKNLALRLMASRD